MGMFDSFYEAEGYAPEHEWQVKAYGCQLASWTIGDRLPQPDPGLFASYQVEVIGGRMVGGSSSWSFATVTDGVLTAVPVERDKSLPLIGYSGGLIEEAS